MIERVQTNQNKDVGFSESAREKRIAGIFFTRFTQEQDSDRRLALVQQARGGRSLNALSPDQQKAVIRKIVDDFVVNVEQKEHDSFRAACKVTDAFLPSVRKRGTKDIVDMYASLLPEFLQQYPTVSGELTNLLDQDAQVVDPEIYLKSIATILRQPGIDSSHKTGAIAGLSFQASFGLLPFLESKLQAIEKTSVEEAATLLTLLNAVRSYGTNWDFSVESSQKIESMLIAFHKQTKSALLKRKAASVLKRFVNIGTGWTPKAVRAWMKYNPHDFGNMSDEDIAELSDEEVMDEWHDALLDPDFQQVVFLNDQSITLDKAQKQQGTDRISVGRHARERYIILPIARGYLGYFSLSGNLTTLLREQPNTTRYSQKDSISLHELPDITLQPWMSEQQKQEAL